MTVEPDDVYGRILARAERSELQTQCRTVMERGVAAVGRRIKQAAVVLARIREIESAAGQLQHDQQKSSLHVNKANCEYVAAIQDLQLQISTTLNRIVKLEGLPEHALNKPHNKSKTTPEKPIHSQGSAKKRQRSGSSESATSPPLSLSYEMQLANLCHVHQFAAVVPPKSVSVWPLSAPIAEPDDIVDVIGDGSDESPIEIELMESDSEAEAPTCYASAVQLQTASTSVQLTQFPLLIRRFVSYLDSLANPKLQTMDEAFVSAVEVAIDIGLSLPLTDSTRAAPKDLLTVCKRVKASSVPLPESLMRSAAELSEYLADNTANAGDGHRLEINSQDQLVMRVDV